MKNLSNKLKQVLFVVLVFSFGIGTAQAGTAQGFCSTPKDLAYQLTSVSIEENPNHEVGGNVVSCQYEPRISLLKLEKQTIKSSDYFKGYLAITPDVANDSPDSWVTIGDAQVCDPKIMQCAFTAMDFQDSPVQVFPLQISFQDLTIEPIVPDEYSCNPEQYKEILEKRAYCERNTDIQNRIRCEAPLQKELDDLRFICAVSQS